MRERRTKIVATLGPATDPPGILDEMVAAGVDCLRLNCSHATPDELRRRAADVRAAAARAGRSLGVLFDLQGPKLRLSADPANERLLAAGDVVAFSGGAQRDDGVIGVDFPEFSGLVTERSEIVIGDGVPRLEVEEVLAGKVVTRTVAPGRLGPRKGINVTYARPELPVITPKDVEDLAVAVDVEADFVALSFVRTAADVDELTERLREAGSHARTIAKIEKVEAYENLDAIIHAADGIMVARGDYGIEAGVARVPLMQKDAIDRSTQHGKLVITATQMLESMINAPEPTRAEATDVANAVIDGTSAVMLSAETSVGSYPLLAVRAMAEIAHAAEEHPVIHGRARGEVRPSAAEAVMHAAVHLSDEISAAALVVPTSTGGGARACSKYRPPRPIVGLAHDQRVANQMTLEWGVRPGLVEMADSVETMIEDALVAAKRLASLQSGAPVVLTAGRKTATPGATSLIMVREIP